MTLKERTKTTLLGAAAIGLFVLGMSWFLINVANLLAQLEKHRDKQIDIRVEKQVNEDGIETSRLKIFKDE